MDAPTAPLAPMPPLPPLPSLPRQPQLPSDNTNDWGFYDDVLPQSPDGTLCTLDILDDFEYDAPRKTWIQWFTELKEFKAEHGHYNVPKNHISGLGK